MTDLEGWRATLDVALEQAKDAQENGDNDPAVSVLGSYAQMKAVEAALQQYNGR